MRPVFKPGYRETMKSLLPAFRRITEITDNIRNSGLRGHRLRRCSVLKRMYFFRCLCPHRHLATLHRIPGRQTSGMTICVCLVLKKVYTF